MTDETSVMVAAVETAVTILMVATGVTNVTDEMAVMDVTAVMVVTDEMVVTAVTDELAVATAETVEIDGCEMVVTHEIAVTVAVIYSCNDSDFSDYNLCVTAQGVSVHLVWVSFHALIKHSLP